MQLCSLISAVRLIQLCDRRWVPVEYIRVSFFGAMDKWLYQASEHQNMCAVCAAYDKEVFSGSELRGMFPYLEVIDENTLAVNVHPNCECLLIRI